MKRALQLDFFRELIGFARKPSPAPAPLIFPTAPVEPKASPHGDHELQKQARALFAAIGEPELATLVRASWNPRMRSTAGLAFPRQHRITLNPRLREFGEAEVDRTLRHELAHLLAHHRAGRRRIAPHGREWAQACRDLGLVDEKRCHDLPLPRRKVAARHFYRCPQCEIVLPRVRPLPRGCACLDCCRKHNGGRFSERFRFVRVPAPNSP